MVARHFNIIEMAPITDKFAFVFCFNKMLSYLNIQFDPTNDYKDASPHFMV